MPATKTKTPNTVSEVLFATAEFFKENPWTTRRLSKRSAGGKVEFCLIGGIAAVVSNEERLRDHTGGIMPNSFFKKYKLILRTGAYFAKWLIAEKPKLVPKIMYEVIEELGSRSNRSYMEGAVTFNDSLPEFDPKTPARLIRLLRAAGKAAAAAGK